MGLINKESDSVIRPKEDDEIIALIHRSNDVKILSVSPDALDEQGYAYDPNLNASGVVEYIEDVANPIKPMPSDAELDQLHTAERIETRKEYKQQLADGEDPEWDPDWKLVASQQWKRQMEDQVMDKLAMISDPSKQAAAKFAFWALIVVALNLVVTIVFGLGVI